MGGDHNHSSPVRVVVFTGGPVLRTSIKRFILLLEKHPGINVLAVFCESPGANTKQVLADLWRRRKWLAGPLYAMHLAGAARQYLFSPGAAFRMKRQMRTLNDRIQYIPDIHAPVVLETIRKLSPELGLIYGSPILKPEIFELPTCGTLGIHHGKLPAYRGKKTTFWAMYNNEPEAGVTIQKVNAGLDTGEIVREGTVSTAGRSLRAVWNALEELGYQLYIDAIIAMKEGTATFRKPQGSTGRLLRDPGMGHLLRFYWKRITRYLNGSP